MLPRNHPDRIQIAFDDPRLVANAGLLLPVTLAQHLGLREVVDSHVDLGDAPGRANPGDKLLTLVASALAGISYAYVSNIELGENPATSKPANPSRDIVLALARELSLCVDESLALAGHGPSDSRM